MLVTILLSCLLAEPMHPPAAAPAAQERVGSAADIRKIIDAAKNRVYPAVVFVKPIREEFSGGEQQRREVFGSGVLISPDGLVVSNHHVVDQAVEIRCVLSDKRQVPAELVGQDAETDLALLQLKDLKLGENLPYAAFADSDVVQAGDFVMAMGAPFGFSRSISLGIVSNTERYMGFESRYVYNTFIQTDAAINPGNSGGPLVDTDGRVIGINTLAITGGQGLGFSIPSNVVTDIVTRLRKGRRVERAETGLQLQPLQDFNSNTFTNSERGVLIRDVDRDSPAEQAGLRAGDLLLEINGKPVTATYIEEVPSVRRLLADLPIGQPAKLTVRRGSEPITALVSPALKGSIDLSEFSCKRWNFTVREFNDVSDPDLAFYHKSGVAVAGVRTPGNAQKSGLRRQDIVLKIDGRDVKTTADVKKVYQEIMAQANRQPKVLLEIQRGQFRQPLVLDYREDFTKED
jgi:serine protease Do